MISPSTLTPSYGAKRPRPGAPAGAGGAPGPSTKQKPTLRKAASLLPCFALSPFVRSARGISRRTMPGKEGYPSVEAYKEVFRRIYGWWNTDAEVWVVDFEVVSTQ